MLITTTIKIESVNSSVCDPIKKNTTGSQNCKTKGTINIKEWTDKDTPDELVVSKNATKQIDIPIDSPVTGKEKIRDDIIIQDSIMQKTFLILNDKWKKRPNTSGMIFSSKFTGIYMLSNMTKQAEGGEVSAPYTSSSKTYIGVGKYEQ